MWDSPLFPDRLLSLIFEERGRTVHMIRHTESVEIVVIHQCRRRW